MNDLTPLQKVHTNAEDWGKLIVAKGFKQLPKVQNIAQSGHTNHHHHNDVINFVSFLCHKILNTYTVKTTASTARIFILFVEGFVDADWLIWTSHDGFM